GITANMLLPGRIDTERVAQLDAVTAEKLGITLDAAVAAARATIPMGRYGTVEEFAAVGAFLVSEPASYLTGSLIRCDGGLVKGV
ncbi:MAG: SDR family oxidoreductase, partial [Woeseiaceae bacterium]